jgi:hypothetical protein
MPNPGSVICARGSCDFAQDDRQGVRTACGDIAQDDGQGVRAASGDVAQDDGQGVRAASDDVAQDDNHAVILRAVAGSTPANTASSVVAAP